MISVIRKIQEEKAQRVEYNNIKEALKEECGLLRFRVNAFGADVAMIRFKSEDGKHYTIRLNNGNIVLTRVGSYPCVISKVTPKFLYIQ